MSDSVNQTELRIVIKRGDEHLTIEVPSFEDFALQHGDELAVVPNVEAAKLPTTWGDVNIEIASGHAVRVPPLFELYEFKGYQIPAHLIHLTGAGPETFQIIGAAHIDLYRRFVGLESDMTILEVGCGIGRDALQLTDILSQDGRYVGIDVTRDSIVWCHKNISPQHENFEFHHFDAINELYNPFGSLTTMDYRLPVDDGSVDRIVLASVFTHLLEDEVLHYLQEFRRVLKPSGKVYASFFLYSDNALAAARESHNTPWKATFAHSYGGGVYGNDPDYPRGAVAFTDAAMRRLIDSAGLYMSRPYLKGAWSGLHDEPDEGQDAVILGLG